ncbi:MAG: hypothetical protein GWP91_25150 [Rhodobacterales bacterium]|nr:hypothetical protein [Rhodobacterales bacterium]
MTRASRQFGQHRYNQFQNRLPEHRKRWIVRLFRLPWLCAEDRGYNLHAAVVIRQGDREGLERLCRCVLRPPLARTRLHRRPDGLLVLTLRKPYANGATDFIFIFSEFELAQKLAALVPPNRKNGVTYHGVRAPRHRLRNQVIPEPPETEPRERLCKTPAKGTSRWYGWAELLWRVFEIYGLACVCGGRLTLHAVVRPPATLDVPNSLERSANRKARGPPLPKLASA